MADPITNIFVLMLENRSFDHMLGFSGIQGTDAVTGQPTAVEGPGNGVSFNYGGQPYPVATPAPDPMRVDPGHEFVDVLAQLCGSDAAKNYNGGAYPPIDNSGFLDDYVSSPSPEEGNAPGNYGDILGCFTPAQLPVLNALARAYAVCDEWYSAMPGPTWPNRFFAHAASSGGLDDSPTNDQIKDWEIFSGFAFPKGTIFDALAAANPPKSWRIYAGDAFPGVAGLKGIHLDNIISVNDFAADVKQPGYPASYTFIEPSYGDIENGTFANGSSQHPIDTVFGGELLIKQVYEAITQSPHWSTSLLIITWDEHGGFYDHKAPPPATPPNDGAGPGSTYNKHRFAFDRLGVRVPAVIVSPWIPAGTIDHREYDHSSIPKTIEQVFGLAPLTARDAAAADVLSLRSLPAVRTDFPVIPDPAPPGVLPAALVAAAQPAPDAPIDGGPMQGHVLVAARQDAALSPPEQQQAIADRVATINTYAQAAQYLGEVKAKMQAAGIARA